MNYDLPFTAVPKKKKKKGFMNNIYTINNKKKNGQFTKEVHWTIYCMSSIKYFCSNL